MKLIVGLGNSGEKYKNNRHNVGFMSIDYLVEKLKNFKVKKFERNKMLYVACFMFHDFFLAKPQTFMNQSGKAIKKLLSNFKTFRLSNLIVIHDDLDIPLGKFKIQKGVGPKLHKGIESIEKELGRQDFWRVRIGIDNRLIDNKKRAWVDGETYVLQDFTGEEKQIIVNQVFPEVFERLKIILKMIVS